MVKRIKTKEECIAEGRYIDTTGAAWKNIDMTGICIHSCMYGKPKNGYFVEDWMIVETDEFVDHFIEKLNDDKPDYMKVPWHLYKINDGAEIHYIKDGFSTEVPLLEEYIYDQHSNNIELLKYIVSLHNERVKS